MPKEIGVMQKTMLKCSGKFYNNKNQMIILLPGKSYSVKEFINEACKQIGFKIKWTGKGLKEKAILINGKKRNLNTG